MLFPPAHIIVPLYEEPEKQQVFQNVQEKTPPDQIMMMMKMIEKISLQMERLETISQKC